MSKCVHINYVCYHTIIQDTEEMRGTHLISHTSLITSCLLFQPLQDVSPVMTQPGTAASPAQGAVCVEGADRAQCLTAATLGLALIALTAWKVGCPFIYCSKPLCELTAPSSPSLFHTIDKHTVHLSDRCVTNMCGHPANICVCCPPFSCSSVQHINYL